MKRQPDPDAWVSRNAGMGSCFHQAIDRWVLLAENDSRGEWRIAIGVVRKNPFCLQRHLHAWLQSGAKVISAVTGNIEDRQQFYSMIGIESMTVRLVPNRIVRTIVRQGAIDRAAVTQLLNAWGGEWVIRDGGAIPLQARPYDGRKSRHDRAS